MVKKVATALLAYPACWIAAHCAPMLSRGDGLALDHLLPYFRAAWNFSGGELPGFIWLLSIALYIVFPAGCFMQAGRRRAGTA